MGRLILPALLALSAAGGCCRTDHSAGKNLVEHADFGWTSVSSRWPEESGTWGGDVAEITGPEQGVHPAAGTRMLKFLYTSHAAHAWNSNTSEVVQIIDLSTYQQVIGTGEATITASALFNRAADGEKADTQFGVSIFAYSGKMSEHTWLRESGEHLARSDGTVVTDDDPATWQPAEAVLELPADTDFITVTISANENVHNDETGTEFSGHYADCVFVSVPAGP